MKSILKKLGLGLASGVFLLTTTVITSAETADELLRDLDFYVEINPQNFSENFQTAFSEELFEFTKDELVWSLLRYDAGLQKSPNFKEMQTEVAEIIMENGYKYATLAIDPNADEENPVTEEELEELYEECLIAQSEVDVTDLDLCEEFIQEDQEPLTYQDLYLLAMPESQYQEIFRDELESQEDNDAISSEILEGIKVFVISSDYGDNKAYTYLQGHLLVGTEDFVKKVVVESQTCDSTCPKLLKENEEYQEVKNKLSPKSLLTIYASDGDEFTKIFYDEFYFYGAELMDLDYGTEELGISLAQTEEGLELQTYNIQNPERLAELGADFSNLPAMELYKKLPGNNVIAAIDTVAVAESLEMMKNDPLVLEVLDEATYMISTELNQEITNEDLLNLFGSEMGMVVQATTLSEDQELPALGNYIMENGETKVIDYTFVSELGENREFATTMIEELKAAYSEEFSGSEKEEYAFEDLFTLEILDDKYVVFSTNPKIIDQFGEGFESEVAKYFSGEKTSGLYFDMEAFRLFLVGISNQVYWYGEEEMNPELMELKEKLDAKNAEIIDLISEPLENLTGYEKLASDYAESKFIFRFDEEKMIENYLKLGPLFEEESELSSQYWDLYYEIVYGMEDAESPISTSTSGTQFADVMAEAWYAESVVHLANLGIIEGYTENDLKVFKPEQEVTRAEFVKMVVEALEDKGFEVYTTFESTKLEVREQIKDLQGNEWEWYANYVFSGYSNGFINGNPDGNFYPKNPINRAEAAEIIGNVVETYNLGSTFTIDSLPVSYEDVPFDHWAAENISKLTSMGIMYGRSTGKFDPSGNLNRAEAATVIDRFLENTSVTDLF